jgi:tRNA G10  N-methylase Trm11
MYLYSISHANGEEELFKMEMKYLFNTNPNRKYFISEFYIDVNRSPFVKTCIDIKFTTDTLEEMVDRIKSQEISYDNFKVKYIDTESNMEFNEKHRIEGKIGYVIKGYAKIHDPEVMIGITHAEGKWIFGEYLINNAIWKHHNNRPCQYSNSLPTKVSRAIVNIVAGRDISTKVIDPCCGIGTVVIEGLSMGVDIKGYDINPKVVEGAKKNLCFFGYEDVISEGDIKEIQGKYDAAIIDIPYGLVTRTTSEIQSGIINSARRITNKLVLVSLDEMDREISTAGFSIVDKCTVLKGVFKRYITISI